MENFHRFPKSVQDEFEEFQIFNLEPHEVAKEINALDNPLWKSIFEKVATDLVSRYSSNYNMIGYLEKSQKPMDLISPEDKSKKKSKVAP